MNELEQTLYDLCLPLVENPSTLSVKQMASLNERQILLYVYGDNNDIARLIGKKGSVATALRQMMMIAARNLDEKIQIKFESFSL